MELIPGNDASAMDKALRDFERSHWSELPAHIQREIDLRRGPSPDFVSLFCNVAEMMYADPAARSNKAKRTIIGQLAFFCDSNGWHGWRGGRGFAVQRAMARDNGEEALEGNPWPPRDDDPAPDSSFAPPEEPADETGSAGAGGAG
jgi:hypothetical protein